MRSIIYVSLHSVSVRSIRQFMNLLLLGCFFSISFVPLHVNAAPVRSYEQQLEQVRLYINNSMFEAALAELVKLRQTQRGVSDERLYIALAKVNYKLHYITMALSDLRKAIGLTSNVTAKKRLKGLYEQWLATYGLVRFESVDQLQNGQLTLTRKRKLINQERKSALEVIQTQFSKGVELPISVYLPYGAYSANGTSFSLKRNMPVPIIEVMLNPIQEVIKQSTSPNLQRLLYIGLGSVALVVLGAGSYFMLQEETPPNTKLTITISDGR